MFSRKVLATIRFEFGRSLTTSRIATSLVLAFFAPVMLFLIGYSLRVDNVTQQIFFPFFIVSIFHLLGLFLAVMLWATPVVYSELEGKTWSYLAVRPHGKLASTIGKYLNAVFWATATTTVSLFFSCVMVWWFPWKVRESLGTNITSGNPVADEQVMQSLITSSDPTTIFFSLLPCLLLGAFALSAVFIHIGLLAHKRGMIFAVVYGCVETAFSFIPAVISQFTVGYHLRNIGMTLGGIDLPDVEEASFLLLDGGIFWHLFVLAIIAAVHLAGCLYWLHSREYISVDET